jgi:hypothetical protein
MFLHLFRIDLVIFLSCFCYLCCTKTVYSILFLPWFANMRFKSSCLLVFTYSLHHCSKTVTSFVYDRILSSYLTLVMRKLSTVWLTLGSCLIHAIAFASDLCICLWYRQSWAKYFSSCNLNCYQLAVTPWTYCERFFSLLSVNTYWLAP